MRISPASRSAIFLALAWFPVAANAGPVEDCAQQTRPRLALAGCTQIVGSPAFDVFVNGGPNNPTNTTIRGNLIVGGYAEHIRLICGSCEEYVSLRDALDGKIVY